MKRQIIALSLLTALAAFSCAKAGAITVIASAATPNLIDLFIVDFLLGLMK